MHIIILISEIINRSHLLIEALLFFIKKRPPTLKNNNDYEDETYIYINIINYTQDSLIDSLPY